MMPLAPQLSVPHIGQISATPTIRNTMKASKPKLSFSIDSIVGKRKTLESVETGETGLNETELLAKSIKRHLSDQAAIESAIDNRTSLSPEPNLLHQHSVSPLSNGSNLSNGQSHQFERASPIRSPSPLSLVTGSNTHSQSPNQPQIPPALQAQFLNRPTLGLPPANHSTLSSISQGTSPGQMPQVAPLGHPNHPMMVAAAAAAAAASSAHQFPPMPSEYQQAFYPWFLRANPMFAGRFPGMPFDSPLGSFLLPPFRKPKRIRTAFSPGQLLKLEQAFEKNHYVVGNERKQLANHLGLSETQVKVWFQNRRTKHKRQKQEDEDGSGSGSVINGENCNGSKEYTDDEEEIDLEEDEESTSDQEHENGSVAASNAAAALKFANMHHLWYQSVSAGLVTDAHPPVSSSSST